MMAHRSVDLLSELISTEEELSLQKILESYQNYLRDNNPDKLRSINILCKSNIVAAEAEAVVFSIFQKSVDSIGIHEDISTGGPDFVCHCAGSSFLVEVTTIEAKTVEKSKSGRGVGSYGLLTNQLKGKLSKKTSQLSGHKMPGILVVCSTHPSSDDLFSMLPTEMLFTGTRQIMVPVDHRKDGNNIVVERSHLANSAFFTSDNGKIKSCRQTINVVLLASIQKNQTKICGIVHPDPTHNLDLSFLYNIPLLGCIWPIPDSHLASFWTNENASGIFPHKLVLCTAHTEENIR